MVGQCELVCGVDFIECQGVSDRRRVLIVRMCSEDSDFGHLLDRSFGERVKIINSRHKSNYKGELELNCLFLQFINL